MRFCTFSFQERVIYGCETTPGELVDLRKAALDLVELGELPQSCLSIASSPDLKSWFGHGSSALELAAQIRNIALLEREKVEEAVVPLKRVRLMAPIPRPGKIVAVGLNYRDHAEEQGAALPEFPRIFAKFPTAVIGPDEPIKIPPISRKVDPEAELCVVVLEGGRRFDRPGARKRAAFMVGTDVSARDLQYADRQWVRGKSCDTFAPIGPYIVTMEEVGDPHKLDIELRVNEEIRQSSNTSNLIFDCFHLMEFISQAITLEAGDIIYTGTPGGVGVFRDPPVFLEPGDIVEVSIEKLGTLQNPVVAG